MTDSSDVVAAVVFSWLFFSAMSGITTCGCVNNAWEEAAKKRGLMEYNQKTGALEWKAPVPAAEVNRE